MPGSCFQHCVKIKHALIYQIIVLLIKFGFLLIKIVFAYQIIVLKEQACISSKDTNPTFILNHGMREGNADCNLILII